MLKFVFLIIVISSPLRSVAQSEQTNNHSKGKVSQDTAFAESSGITSITLNDKKIMNLTKLGMLWGFLKYYHAEVCKGNFNMDAELFRILPGVITANEDRQLDSILEHWIDHFGVPPICTNCSAIQRKYNTVLLPDFGMLFQTGSLPTSMIKKLDYIRRNRFIGDKHYYVSTDPEVGITFDHERSYENLKYPDAGIRLLALFRYWNIYKYFAPNRDVTTDSWNQILPKYIPIFINAKNALQYQLACLQLITEIHDSHAGIWTGANEIEQLKGSMILPVKVKIIDSELIVTGYYKYLPGVENQIRPGDIIEKIDSVDVQQLVKKYLPITPGSNYETQLRNMCGASGFLLRGKRHNAHLIVRQNGEQLAIDLMRIAFEDNMAIADFQGSNTNSGYKLINQNIGYIYPALLKEGDFENIKQLMSATKGIIFDLRCYPAVFIPFSYGQWLKTDTSAFAIESMPDINIPGMFNVADTEANGGQSSSHYHGKVVIIVNEITQSRAEFTVMGLATAPGAITIGSRTAGADGGLFQVMLPGGMVTTFTGIGIYYPDGTLTQRVGIKIDKIIRPTISGIKDGHDELLEEAINIISAY